MPKVLCVAVLVSKSGCNLHRLNNPLVLHEVFKKIKLKNPRKPQSVSWHENREIRKHFLFLGPDSWFLNA